MLNPISSEMPASSCLLRPADRGSIVSIRERNCSKSFEASTFAARAIVASAGTTSRSAA